MKRNDIAKGVILVGYMAAIAILCAFHEPWLDEIIAWDIAVNNDVWGVLERMATEGHFATWHMLLYPLAHCGVSCLVGLPLVSCALMSAAAWWLLYRSPFTLLTSVCILASAPVLYYFPVISRVYALIPLALWLTAYCYPHRHEWPVRYGLCIGFIINTHSYMEGLAMALLACWAWEIWQKRHTAETRRALTGYCVALLLGLLAFAQIVGNFFLEKTAAFKHTDELWPLVRGLVHVSFSTMFIHQDWSVVRFCGCIVALATVLLYVRAMWHSKKEICIAAFAIVYMLAFGVLIYGMALQRIWLPFCVIVFSLWIGNVRRSHSFALMATLLIMGAWGEARTIKHDLYNDYAGDKAVQRRMVQDSNPHKYLHVCNSAMRYLTTCFGRDTINGQRFDNLADMTEAIVSDGHDSVVVYGTYRISWEGYAGSLATYDSLRVALMHSGYQCTRASERRVSIGQVFELRFQRSK